MNISKFKKGDIITRVKCMRYPGTVREDHSYMGTQFEYIGSNENTIVLVELNQYGSFGECKIETLQTEYWGEGWDFYPIDKIKEGQLKLYAIAEAILFEEQNTKDSIVGKYKKGQLVKTNDNRYGFIKEIDWHARMFIKRDDYQIQFPDGVGIFRADEFEVIENPPI